MDIKIEVVSKSENVFNKFCPFIMNYRYMYEYEVRGIIKVNGEKYASGYSTMYAPDDDQLLKKFEYHHRYELKDLAEGKEVFFADGELMFKKVERESFTDRLEELKEEAIKTITSVCNSENKAIINVSEYEISTTDSYVVVELRRIADEEVDIVLSNFNTTRVRTIMPLSECNVSVLCELAEALYNC